MVPNFVQSFVGKKSPELLPPPREKRYEEGDNSDAPHGPHRGGRGHTLEGVRWYAVSGTAGSMRSDSSSGLRAKADS